MVFKEEKDKPAQPKQPWKKNNFKKGGEVIERGKWKMFSIIFLINLGLKYGRNYLNQKKALRVMPKAKRRANKRKGML